MSKLERIEDPWGDVWCTDKDVQELEAYAEKLEAKYAQLLEALKWALSNINCEPYEWGDEKDADAHEAARAAIAKAEAEVVP